MAACLGGVLYLAGRRAKLHTDDVAIDAAVSLIPIEGGRSNWERSCGSTSPR